MMTARKLVLCCVEQAGPNIQLFPMTPVSADNLRKAVVITCYLDLNIGDYLIVNSSL
jgi:hypothetical protein